MSRYRMATAVGCAMAAALALVPSASADDEPPPTERELLELCDNGTDLCVFHPAGPPEYYPDTEDQVGSPVFNCTDQPQLMSVNWSDTTTESNSLGLSMSAGFGEVFKVTFKASYGHEWTESHTEAQTTFVETRPGEVGRVYHGPQMQKVFGTYELHFEDPYKGHYVWYVDLEVTGPAGEEPGTVTQSTKPMTPEEEAANCG